MFPQIFVVCALAAFASAEYIEPSLSTFKFSVEEPALRIVSPAEIVPGSYSSSFRSDVISPRLRLTETPTISYSVPDSTIAFAPSIARVEKIVPAFEKVERVVPSIAIDSSHLLRTKLDLVEPLPISRGYLGHAGLTIPITRGVATGHVF